MNGQSTPDFQENEVSLQDYLRIIYKGRWIIVAAFVLVMVATVYYTFTAPPQYESSTLLMLAGRQGQTSMLFQSPFMVGNYLKVNNEIEVLKSDYLARRVVYRLQNSPYADSLYILGTREYDKKGIGFGDFVGVVKTGLKRLLLGAPEEELVTADSLQRAIVRQLKANVTVEPIRDTEAIRLKVTSVDPYEAAFLANSIANEYLRLDEEFNLGEVVEMKTFLEEQLEDIEKDLVASEEALKQFQKEAGVYVLDETAQTLIDQLSTFEATYYTSLAELQVARQKLENQQKVLNEREKWIVDEAINTTNPLIVQLRQAVAEMEAEKITAMTVMGYGPGSEAVAEFDKRISELKKRLLEEAQNVTNLGLSPEEQSTISLELLRNVLLTNVDIIALESRSGEYKKLVDQYNARLNQLPERSLEFARLDRDRQVNEKYYILMKTKYQETRITEASKISNIRIVDPAIPPEKPVKPKKQMNLLLGMFLGVGLGVGIAFVREYLDHSVRSSEDLDKLGLTTISIVPKIDIKSSMDKIKTGEKMDQEEYTLKSRMISHYDPKSTVAEAYRTLRTNIQFINPDQPLTSMVVSSAGPGDGKSTTVVNIAITFANLEKKVLLIDADLRKPVLHKVFDVPRAPGLTHRLIQDLNDQDVIRETQVPNLYLVTCGELPPNPSELLASQKLKDFIVRAKDNFDIVLIDSPPIIAVTDASILSKLTDAILLVVKAGSTDMRILRRSIELLKQVKTNLIGAVLNGVNISAGYDSYYYYYHYYYYYADSGEKKKGGRKARRRKPRLLDKIRG
ncbi:MAG: GumC family protein [Fidelibacterota bacterium]